MYFNENTIYRLEKKRSPFQFFTDRFFFFLICLIPSKATRRIGLTPLDEERLIYAFRYLKGKVLDVGCGDNTLIKSYGNGIGVDVYPWEGVDILIKDPSDLPFDDGSFDTVTFIASLNHIRNREDALREANRVLRPGGLLVISMINPVISIIAHKVRYRYDPDQHERGLVKGEAYGFWKCDLIRLLQKANFSYLYSKKFLYGLNRIYLAEKNEDKR